MLKHRCNWERPCGVIKDSLLHLACLGLQAALEEVNSSEREVELLDDGWFFRGRTYSTWRELEVMHTNDRDLRLGRYRPILEELMAHFKQEGGVEVVVECERMREGKLRLLHYLAKFGFEDCVKLALEVCAVCCVNS